MTMTSLFTMNTALSRVQCSLLYCPNTTVAPGTTRTGSGLGDERYKYLEGKPLQSLYIDRHLIKHNHKIILNKMIIKSCAELFMFHFISF